MDTSGLGQSESDKACGYKLTPQFDGVSAMKPIKYINGGIFKVQGRHE